jgi:glycosyltransferase involved in cell wall biosynthesis
MAPRVLLDLRMVQGRLHGIARYALELARRLPALAPDLRFEALGPLHGLPPLGPLAPPIPVHASAAGFLTFAEQPRFRRSLRRLRPDLFHATSFSVPRFWNGRLVVTLHDATHLVRSDEYGPLTAAYYRWIVRPTLARARGLITVSAFARDELAARLGPPADRWRVIPQGVDARFRPLAATERAGALAPLGLPERFFLAVGNEKRHKNLALLARIADRLPLPLVVLAGADPEVRFPASTRMLEAVGEDQLPALYGAAAALLIPSRHEGFGLPALEAMAAGTAVLAARAGALPEVTGDAAELLDPDDDEAWIGAARRLLDDGALRTRRIEAGRARAVELSWDRTARETLAVYRAALG